MDPFLGEIRLVAFNFAPPGWALCAGQVLPISQNTALFSLLGNSYGGDGLSTFALPDLRGRVPVGAGQGATGTDYELGSTGGEEITKLTAAQLPAHSHRVRASTGESTTNNPSNGLPAAGGAYTATRNTMMGATMIGRSGGGRPHDNRQPYVSLNYIIALQGIFPAHA